MQPGDAFCPHCGEAIEAVRVKPAPPAPAPAPRDQLAGTDPESGPADLAAASLPRPADPGPSRPTDCTDLEVRYNNSCVFVLNMQSTFDFEIRPLVNGLRDLAVEVRQSGQVIARETPRVIPRQGTVLTLGLNYAPRHTQAGRVAFEILISYRQDRRRRLFAAYRTHTIQHPAGSRRRPARGSELS